jgi:hypothetical protein
MKRSTGIKSVESKAIFHEAAFEEFINGAMPAQTSKDNKRSTFSDNYKRVGWCGAYVPFNGTVDILAAVKKTNDIRRISIPVSSAFLVLCTKEYGGKYKIAWSCSMS